MTPHSLLLVEDDENIRSALATFFQRKGFFVGQAENGRAGLERLHERAYDVVISDIMMPEVNGMVFLEETKRLRPNSKVVMITGYADTSIAIEAMKKGASDFVCKPFQFDYLEQTVARLLPDPNAAPPEVVAGEELAEIQRLNSKLERKVQELSVLHSINEALEEAESGEDLFHSLCELAASVCRASSAAYYLHDRETGTLILQTAVATVSVSRRPTTITLPADVVTNLERHRRPQRYADSHGIGFYSGIVGQTNNKPTSAVLAPFYVRGEYFGLLTVEEKNNGNAFGEEDINYITMLLKKAGMSIENRALYETIHHNLISTLHSLVSTIEAKDPYTRKHSDRVTRLSVLIGHEMGCSEDDLETLQFAGMLHDVGKIGISDAVLQKSGRLTDEEFDMIKQHPVIGERILAPLGMSPEAQAIIRHHHERWDGRGYPDGLQGTEIPFLVRIVTLADSYDAMTSNRVYRAGLPHEVAVKEIEANRWTQFDGNVAQAFLALCRRYNQNLKFMLETDEVFRAAGNE
ncbi:MAG: response regulator [Deltaproteobacteria bacterium]|nr:response regulator [bacterium]MCB9478212.1 response regulator [Deltaproteobacteria bacterium]MCB9487235.1 response regulator [Deltaproteobacteria bacterium]